MVLLSGAVTDATGASQVELEEAISLFLPNEALSSLSFTRCEGGANNKVYRVDCDGSSYILRIYNNGLNTPRVEYEHALLSLLRAPWEAMKPAWEIPTLIPSKAGEVSAGLKDGARACLFKVIPGRGASMTSTRSIGRSTAQLLNLMAKVDESALPPCPNPLYRNLFDAHHITTRENFFEAFAGPEFEKCSAARDALAEEILAAERVIQRALTLGLPEQLIHADLHFLNVLVHEDSQEVTGVLDFEFACRDWRVMELAVGLSKYVGMKDIDQTIVEYFDGFKEGFGEAKITAAEAELLPDMIKFRILSNVIYFLGRYLAKEDSIEALTSRAEMYRDRCIWIDQKRQWIVKTTMDKLTI